MYNSQLLDPEDSPKSLQNKVQMDLRYYFVRRGCENIYNWTKDTFKIVTDKDTNLTYIEKVQDEETKNHKEVDSDIITAYMPEISGSKMCPVMSFTTYVSSLSPQSKYLWQSARFNKFNYSEKVWFGPGRVGQNTLDSFVTNLSQKLGMKDKKYTNHSLRVSGITNLTRENFTNKQIMSISGHKNQDSLAIYQKVNSDEKLRMGLTLGFSLMNPPAQHKALLPAQISNQNLPTIMYEPSPKKQKLSYEPENPIPTYDSTVAIVANSPPENQFNVTEFDISDQDLMNMITDTANSMEMTQYSAENKTSSTVNETTVTTKQVLQKRTSPRPPLFSNCNFHGGVTININK